MTIFGPDISNNNGVVNIDRVADEGFDFVFAKVSEGSGFRDKYWPKTRDWCAARGLICVGYHYVKTDNADAQAACFANNGGGNIVMFDFEAGSGGIDNFWRVVRAFNARGIRVVLSYIPRWYWQGTMGSPDISNIPGLLIQSSYVSGKGGAASVMYPGDNSRMWNGFGGKQVDILQFTDAARVAGINLDCNAFRGSKEQLAAALGLGPAVPNRDEDEMAGWNEELVNRAMVLLENIAGVPRESGSPLRPLGDQYRDTSVGFARTADGAAHFLATYEAAKAGSTKHIQAIKDVAAGLGDPKWADRQDDAKLAKALLDSLGVKN